MAASMSNVEIRGSLPNKGKGLFAVRNIQEDAALFEENPLVCSQFLWNKLYRYSACNHCMRSLETAEESSRRLSENSALVLPYPECCEVQKDKHAACPHCQAAYCSSECCDAAWSKYHMTLCLRQSTQDPDHPLVRLQETWRNMHYPPESASITLITRMIASVKQAEDKGAVIASFSEFCKATVNDEEEIAHKLLGQQFQEQLELLRNLLAEGLFDEDLQQWFTPEGFRSLFALIGTNGQGVGTSSLSTWVHNCDALELKDDERQKLDSFIDQLYVDIEKVSGTFLNCEGSALYTLQSACNHSCVPNAEITFPNGNFTLVLKALRDIEEGEEICICYLDECSKNSSRHTRQKILRENYLFTCDCVKCMEQADEPDVTSEEDEDEDMEDD